MKKLVLTLLLALVSTSAMAGQDEAQTQLQSAATGEAAIIDYAQTQIMTKIRANMVLPHDVPSSIRAEFLVTLLPNGNVQSIKLEKPSGNNNYDIALELAILKSQPLPIPNGPSLFNRFRELSLMFKPN